MSLITRKPVFKVSDKVRLKLACSAYETSKVLEILAIASRGIVLSRQRTTKGADQTAHLDCADAQADLRLVVRIWHKQVFS